MLRTTFGGKMPGNRKFRFPLISVSLVAPLCMLGLLAGCADPKRTIVYREWSERKTLIKDLSMLDGDSLSAVSEYTLHTMLAGRDLAALADTADDWNLDTAGIRIDIPSLEATRPFNFQILSNRSPAPGDTIGFADGDEPDTNRPEVLIQRLDRSGIAYMLVTVPTQSLSLMLAGIPFDPAFAPVLPANSRIKARKAARLRLVFDGRVLEGEVHIVEYRYGSTTVDVEHEGL